MIITPSTALVTEATNPATAARFPCVQHFWQCKETSGTSLADAMERCDLTGAASMTFGADYVVPNEVVATGTLSGTLTNVGTSPCMLIQVAKAAAGGLVIGDGDAEDSLSLARSGGSAIIDGTATDATTQAWTTADTTIMVRALVVKDFGGNAQNISFNCSTNAYTAHTAFATTNTSDLSTGMTTWGCASTVTELYGTALFKFATIPTDAELQGIIAWCGYAWSRGYKTLPPWLVGRA